MVDDFFIFLKLGMMNGIFSSFFPSLVVGGAAAIDPSTTPPSVDSLLNEEAEAAAGAGGEVVVPGTGACFLIVNFFFTMDLVLLCIAEDTDGVDCISSSFDAGATFSLFCFGFKLLPSLGIPPFLLGGEIKGISASSDDDDDDDDDVVTVFFLLPRIPFDNLLPVTCFLAPTPLPEVVEEGDDGDDNDDGVTLFFVFILSPNLALLKFLILSDAILNWPLGGEDTESCRLLLLLVMADPSSPLLSRFL